MKPSFFEPDGPSENIVAEYTSVYESNGDARSLFTTLNEQIKEAHPDSPFWMYPTYGRDLAGQIGLLIEMDQLIPAHSHRLYRNTGANTEEYLMSSSYFLNGVEAFSPFQIYNVVPSEVNSSLDIQSSRTQGNLEDISKILQSLKHQPRLISAAEEGFAIGVPVEIKPIPDIEPMTFNVKESVLPLWAVSLNGMDLRNIHLDYRNDRIEQTASAEIYKVRTGQRKFTSANVLNPKLLNYTMFTLDPSLLSETTGSQDLCAVEVQLSLKTGGRVLPIRATCTFRYTKVTSKGHTRTHIRSKTTLTPHTKSNLVHYLQCGGKIAHWAEVEGLAKTVDAGLFG